MFCAAVRKERPGESWILPTTLFTRILPATLQPSSACSLSLSDHPSLTHYRHISICCELVGSSVYLFDRVRSIEAPASVEVSLPHGLTSVAATTLWRFSTIARAAVIIATLFIDLVEIVPKLVADR